MKIHTITNDKNIALGLSFSGISSDIVSDKENLKKALDKAISDKEIGIILINQGLWNLYSEYIIKLKLLSRRRIILKIPDTFDADSFKNSVSSRIRKVLGGGKGGA